MSCGRLKRMREGGSGENVCVCVYMGAFRVFIVYHATGTCQFRLCLRFVGFVIWELPLQLAAADRVAAVCVENCFCFFIYKLQVSITRA